jgi:hypothetical protein
MVSTRHVIQGWNHESNQTLKEELLKIGIPDKDIEFLTERKSRSYLLNKCFKAIPQHYKHICLYDSDIVLDGTDFVKSLSEDLERNPNVGAVIIPAYQFTENEIPFALESPLPANSSESYLRDVSFLTTFNVIMFRRSLFNKGLKFDEDLWGSQLLDVAIGVEINRMGFSVVADLRHSLGHKQSDFAGKNLCYHAIVSRNRHVLREKMMNRDAWVSVDDYNEKHPENRIPSIEEITHASEKWMIEYTCSWDGLGFQNCYLLPRFKDLNAIHGYYNGMVNVKNNTPDKYKFIQNSEGWGFGL